MKKEFDPKKEEGQFQEVQRESDRFIVAYSPEIAADAKRSRLERIKKADTWIKEAENRLANPNSRGRTPTAQGTYDRIRDYLCDRNLLGLYEIDLANSQLSVKKNQKARTWEDTIDGMLMLETTDQEMSAKDIVKRYKELAEIERGWRTLKSSLLLRPVYHWTESRIRAHIFICVLALQVERWMRNRLESVSVQKALASLQRIKMGDLQVNGKAVKMATRPAEEQKELLAKLGVKPIPRKIADAEFVV